MYYQKKFKKDVIDSFVESYIAGETPIPCVQCNQTVKFRDLYEYSKELGADALITGHYVNSIHNDGISEMYRAKDHERDQSYFLFNTNRDQLNFLRFPLGKYTKKETRKIAKRLKLNVADKPDSQDICFVPNGDYVSVIKKFKPESFKKGNIKDLNDNIIGTHEGIINFTIGQRKGIGVTNKEALYVVKINSNNNEIVVGPKSSLAVDKIKLRNLNQLCDNIEECNSNLFVKVRSTGKLLKAEVKVKLDNNLDGFIDKENLSMDESEQNPRRYAANEKLDASVMKKYSQGEFSDAGGKVANEKPAAWSKAKIKQGSFNS